MTEIFLGQWKFQNVYCYKDIQTNTWTLFVKHSFFGDLIQQGLKSKPKIGMAKRYFKDKLKELNDLEKLNNDRDNENTYKTIDSIFRAGSTNTDY